ncbi:NERD domain-containing protein [Microlunatus endophyticus]|nr:NERD domain-containing protein [Microlunatus endophyticus]
MPGDDMDPDAIEAAASNIAGIGSSVTYTTGNVAKQWAGLKNAYQAPEQETLYGAMHPATQAAGNFDTDLGSVCRALTAFAEDVRKVKKSVVQIRADATTFLAGIHGGKVSVEKTHTYAGGYGVGGATTDTEDVDWDSDPDTVEKNNNLIRRTNDQEEQLLAAERTCANAIYDIYGAKHIAPASGSNPGGFGVTEIPDNDSGLAWGNTVDVKETWSQKLASGFDDTIINGFGALIGFHWTQTSASTAWSMDFSGSTFFNTWKGMGDLAQGLEDPLTPILNLIPGPVGQSFTASAEAAAGFAPGLLGIDPFKHDPSKNWLTDLNGGAFDKWKNNPWQTAGSVLANAVTFAIPGPKGLGALGKAGKASEAAEESGEAANAARTAEDAARLGELAGKGSDVSKLAADATKTELGDLGTTVKNLGAETKGLDKTDIDIPNVPDDKLSTDQPNAGGHTPSPAPAPRGIGHGVHLAKGLAHRAWESAHGYGPGTHAIDAKHPEVNFGKDSNDVGRIGEKLTRQDLIDRGYRIISTQTRIKIPGTHVYFKPDFIAVDPHGNLVLIESKMNAGAKFTANQLVGYDHYAKGQPLAGYGPRGQAALRDLLRQHGVRPNQPVSGVQVYRWNTEIVPDAGLRARAGVP